MIKVAVKLRTALEEEGQWEYHTIQATGDFYRTNTMDVVMFTEESDAGPVKTMVTIQSESVSIKRSGALTMHQQFNLHRSTESSMQHPYITIHMDTHTSSIHYDADGGHLVITYTVKLDGEDPRPQQLDLHMTRAHAVK